MFNHDIKDKYLSELSSVVTKESAKYIFEKAEDYERKFGKDLSEMSISEIAEFILSFSSRKESRQNRLSYIRSYISWAASNGMKVVVTSSDISGLLNAKTGEGFLTKYVFSPEHLAQYLDSVFDPQDLHTADLLYRGFLWLAFMGVPLNLIEQVKTCNVSIDDEYVVADGEYYPMYKESVQTFGLLKDLPVFNLVHPLHNSTAFRERTDNGILLRKCEMSSKNKANKDSNARQHSISSDAHSKIKRAILAEKCVQNITYGTAKLSGVFYKMYMREQAGIDVNFWASAAKIVVENGCDDIGTPEAKAKIRRHKCCLNRDYEAWKEAKYMYERLSE